MKPITEDKIEAFAIETMQGKGSNQKASNFDRKYCSMNTSIQPPLTNLQMELLKLFSRQLPDKDLHAIRDLIAQYLLERSFELADEEWDKRGYTVESFQQKIKGNG